MCDDAVYDARSFDSSLKEVHGLARVEDRPDLKRFVKMEQVIDPHGFMYSKCVYDEGEVKLYVCFCGSAWRRKVDLNEHVELMEVYEESEPVKAGSVMPIYEPDNVMTFDE